MKKKVIDIIPKKELERTSLKEFHLEKESRIKLKKPEIRVSFLPGRKKILIFGLPLFISALIFCYFNLSKAEIEIWPETEILTFQTKLTVDKKAEAPDFSAKVISGKVFEKEKTITENFASSGKALKEKKAEGTIKVYNEYSATPQILIATTRFVSVDGKLFRTPIRVTIPGGHYEKGKFVPGEIDIKVVADQPGPEYNIEPSTFSIPGFAGTDRYTKFYGKSFKAMEGGISEKTVQVTQEDLERAENALTEKIKEECLSALNNELDSEEKASEFIFLEDAVRTEVVEKFAFAKPGDEFENFNFQVEAKSETLLFKKEEIENFTKEFIKSQLSEREGNDMARKIYEESLEISYSPETIDLKDGQIILSLEVSAKIYSDIDISLLRKWLKGKSLTETRIFLENQPKITKIKVEFWPFWVKKVPENNEKIKIDLKIE